MVKQNETAHKDDTHPHQAGERYEERERNRQKSALQVMDRMCGVHYDGEYELVGVRLKVGVTDRTETLCVITGIDGEGTPVVCFNTAMTPAEALIGGINRINNGQAKWRPDEYRT